MLAELLLGAAALAGGGADDPAPGYEMIFAGGNIRVPIDDYIDRKFVGVVRQRYDFSCGSAALASLLTYHYDIPRSESDVFLAMWEVGEKELIRKRGFSLLDMKRYLNDGGVPADGFTVPFDKLNDLGLPGIALITVNGYSHFVVVKGVREGEVLIGDPSIGLVTRTEKEFRDSWDGTMLFLRGLVPWGRSSWNEPEAWTAQPEGRFRDRFDDPELAMEAIHYFRDFNSGFAVGQGF